MKNSFAGYYAPSTLDFVKLWNDGIIVLDTNVILNLYRLPSTAREEFFKVLELHKHRLWIPHQVALEFQKRRLTVISSERKATEDALRFASDLISNIKERINSIQIDKRGLGVSSENLVDDLDKANNQLISAFKAAHEQQLDISASDPIRERLDSIFDARIGKAPADQGELDSLTQDGDDRFTQKIPPGFMDEGKDKNPNEASFIFDKLKYQRKFGDLILWKQLIQHVKSNNIKQVILVTADRKEDWWWREQGKTIGPHPELVREIIREGGVEIFWMYSSGQFVEQASQFWQTNVSKESVKEITQISLTSPAEPQPKISNEWPFNSRISNGDSKSKKFLNRSEDNYLMSTMYNWLSINVGDTRINRNGFPDFLVETSKGTHGFEIQVIPTTDVRGLMTPRVANSLMRGYIETNEERIASFTTIFVVPKEIDWEPNGVERFHIRISSLVSKYPITSVIVGIILEDEFHQIDEIRPGRELVKDL